jgi:hypothetical protein
LHLSSLMLTPPPAVGQGTSGAALRLRATGRYGSELAVSQIGPLPGSMSDRTRRFLTVTLGKVSQRSSILHISANSMRP